ncbi:MAG: XdhC family protein [Spirochaetaceae bacterium]|nr:XdhC family protein [Spirochaetaceae bacterium]
MDELQSITVTLSALPAGSVCALATLVHVEGSSYRGVGARALALPGGDTVGMISGGCLEGDLLERATEVLANGRSRTVRYDSTSPEDALLGLGLGCNGVVDVLLERVEPGDKVAESRYLPRISAARAHGHRTALATVYESAQEAEVGARLAIVAAQEAATPTSASGGSAKPEIGHSGTDCSSAPAAPAVASRASAYGRWRPELRAAVSDDLGRLLEAGSSRSACYQVDGAPVRVLLEVIEPPLPLTVCGAGPDAEPLVALAGALGWAPIVFDHRAAFARPERFPAAVQVRTAAREEFTATVPARHGEVVVLMTHSYPTDLQYLEQLAARDVRYIGVLGPRRRLQRLVEELGDRAPAGELLYGPAGLDIGADSPPEIALSILAEIRTALAGRAGTPLRDRATPIHTAKPSAVTGGA